MTEDLSQQLAVLVGDLIPTPTLRGHIDRRSTRLRRGRRGTGLLAAVTLTAAVTVALVAQTDGSSDRLTAAVRPTPGTVPPVMCPRAAASRRSGLLEPITPATAKSFVPVSPVGAVICRYDVSPVGSPLSSQAGLDAQEAASLAASYDAPWTEAAGSVLSCPDDTGATAVVTFLRADGSRDVVEQGLSGCQIAESAGVVRNFPDLAVLQSAAPAPDCPAPYALRELRTSLVGAPGLVERATSASLCTVGVRRGQLVLTGQFGLGTRDGETLAQLYADAVGSGPPCLEKVESLGGSTFVVLADRQGTVEVYTQDRECFVGTSGASAAVTAAIISFERARLPGA